MVAHSPVAEPLAKAKPEKDIELVQHDALNQRHEGSPKLVLKSLLPKPLSSVMSPLTASVNEQALKSLLDLELRNKRAEQAEANFGMIDEPSLGEDREDDSPRSPVHKKPAPADICKSLKQQREHIRDMMLLTNKVFPEYKTEQYDFQILDSKSIGRVEIKA